MLGKYEIQWSSTTIFKENDTIILDKGTIYEGSTEITFNVTIPESDYGLHFIRFITENNPKPVTVKFNVKPGIEVTPTSVKQGSSVSLSGTGFPPVNIVTVTLGGKRLNTDISTDETGGFDATLVLTDISTGNYDLTAKTEYVLVSATTGLEIVPAAITSDETPEEPQTPPSTSDSTEQNSPSGPTDDRKAPSKPMPINPTGQRINLIGAEDVLFEWSKASDTGSVLYTIEIYDTYSFSSSGPLIQKSGLKNRNYSAYLEPGTYYWRVKAVDDSGNESNWSNSPYAVKVGELSVLIDEFTGFLTGNQIFIILLVIGVCVLILCILTAIVRSLIGHN
jgi:hypothetical protein